jgi:hypothetical protein
LRRRSDANGDELQARVSLPAQYARQDLQQLVQGHQHRSAPDQISQNALIQQVLQHANEADSV